MKGSDVRTGFYLVADKYNLDSQSVMENDEYLGEIYAYPEDLLVDPVFYLHGACDMFALFLAREYDENPNCYKELLDRLKHAGLSKEKYAKSLFIRKRPVKRQAVKLGIR